MTQFLLAAFGLTALGMLMFGNERAKKWAPAVGLAGQPFWFASTVPQGQWGMVALCVAYTALYGVGTWQAVRAAK